MNSSILVMYGVTPCHAGSGSSMGVVDLPIQRERHTGWPMVQGSGVKGSMRMHFEKYKESLSGQKDADDLDNLADLIFGSSSSANDESFASRISVSDAKIAAFPMRSNAAPFVWITSPAVLKRLCRDFAMTGKSGDCAWDEAGLSMEQAFCWQGDITGKVLLEDMEVSVTGKSMPEAFKKIFADAERLLVVHDKVFDYAVMQCTQVAAQIKIDQATGTTSKGSLRYQEELPADTVMYSVIIWDDTASREEDLSSETMKNWITGTIIPKYIQIGGDQSTGRGFFALTWL